MMDDGDGLLARLDSRLVETEMRAVLAEDPGLASLVENALCRARALLEARCILESQVWLAGVTAVVERYRREWLASQGNQEKRIKALVTTLGDGVAAKGLGKLLSDAAALQPDATGELLDVIERALTCDEVRQE